MKDKAWIAASVLIALLAIFLFFRTTSIKADFDATVRESQKTTEGYDQRFIDMVQRLDGILANRASFGYQGGKDPMTGVKREVVQPAPEYHRAPAAPVTQGAPQPQVDAIRVSAIIGDASGKKVTALIMDGERSLTVDVGDVVSGRKITKITNEGVWMENDTMSFFYDDNGHKEIKPRESTPRR